MSRSTKRTLIALATTLFLLFVSAIGFWWLLATHLTHQELTWFIVGWLAASMLSFIEKRFTMVEKK